MDGLPDQLVIEKAHGLAGASEVCAVGSTVLVGFKGGRPSAPFVAHYLTSEAPVSVALDAQTEITLGGAAAVPLAKGEATDDSIEALRVAINAVASAVPVAAPLPDPLGSVATTKVKGE